MDPMIERIIKRPKERVKRIIVPHPPEQMPAPDEFVLRLVEAVMVRRRPAPPVAPPAAPERVGVTPPTKKVVPNYIELDLPSGTKGHEVNFGIKAKSLNIRVDQDISVRLSRGGPSIPISAADSPFTLNLSRGWMEKIWLNTPYESNVKVFCATEPMTVNFGRKEIPTAYRWHWAGQALQPAGTLSEYDLYTIPSDRRLVIESATLSSDVKGVVQRVDFLEWDGATLYRFGGTFFDCQSNLTLNYKMSGGRSLKMRTYNYDTEDRTLWVMVSSREEPLK